MFKIIINKENTTLPNDSIYYVIAKNGIFIKKKLGIVESLTPVDSISILEPLVPTASLDIPKLPSNLFASSVEFFYRVYEKHKSESIVLIFYNEEQKDFQMAVVEQVVTNTNIDYTKITLPGYIMLGTIHSHSNFGAFHSTVDQHDEKHFDGLHITVGNVDDEEPSITACIVINGSRFAVEPCDYIDGITLSENTSEEEKSVAPKYDKTTMIKILSAGNALKKNKSIYKIAIPTEERYFDERWLDKVTKKSYISSLNLYGGYGAYMSVSDIKNNSVDRPIGIQQPTGIHIPGYETYLNEILLPTETKKEDDSEEFDYEDVNPCTDCMFRDCKIDLLTVIDEEFNTDDTSNVEDKVLFNNYIPNDETDEEDVIYTVDSHRSLNKPNSSEVA